ncbi:MAG: glutamine-hydrolyzing carbamoyl-phosphate synthase small subunit [Chloroflexota bacterium]|nr:glutamine-hydrolyzing carbamoyl-phosphate synthase small subunit [Chloroflexota bacterium]MDE3102559.1 glutamine-hydrolyzing carbamoyl-phosphate synthase small subunit [Chloroflexota bacterium]
MARAAVLGLEDGSTWWGEAFGDASTAAGEVVFNTAMTGYQEVSSDASYNGQIVVMTFPLIGSYGTFELAAESRRPWVEALVVRELMSNERGLGQLDAYLRAHGVPGLAGIDTRALVRRLRTAGTVRGAILQVAPHLAGSEEVASEAVAKARTCRPLAQLPLVQEATGSPRQVGSGVKVALIDTGVKENQIRELTRRGACVKVFPATSTARDVLSWAPEGIVITNGPGDPAAIPQVTTSVKVILDAALQRGSARPLPILGICLGHQLLARALGATTSRLRFGHHGSNHPVQDTRTGRVVITSQNHEFQVDEGSLPEASPFFVSARNLNDGSVEGLRHRSLPIRTYQYHPEGAPGPHDNEPVFDAFLTDVREAVGAR